jgi:tetratricopeptide (TPR) repeat protein
MLGTIMGLALAGTAAFPGMAAARDAPFLGETLDGTPCSSYQKTDQGYGPFDYRRYSSHDPMLRLVERTYFTPRTASLEGGSPGNPPQGDINYTLRAFPNHYEALFALIRYYTGAAKRIYGLNPFKQERYAPPECFLRRAIAFSPRDANLYFLFGTYLHRLAKFGEAEKKYRKGLELNPDSAEGNYNFGLLLYEMGRYQEAREKARKAYKLGYPLPGLREKLTQKGLAP